MSAKKSTIPKRPRASAARLLTTGKLAPLVHLIRSEKVLLDSDLAELYGVETRVLNQAVKRNLDRFPEDFMFQLTEDEADSLRSQFVILNVDGGNLISQSVISSSGETASRSQSVTLKRGQHRKFFPYAFTEQGVAMLSSVLRSPRAVEVNIAIMRTFVQLRRLMDSNQLLAEKIETLEQKYAEHDQNFTLVFDAIKQLISDDSTPPRQMGFHTIPEKT